MLKSIFKKFVNRTYYCSDLSEQVSACKVISQKSFINTLCLQAKIGLTNAESMPCLKEFREKKIIVSLTTYPQRDMHVETVIYSLLMQSTLPDKIILWLSNEEYPNGMDDVAHSIKVLQKYGLEIRFCKNIKSYKKLIPTLQEYPNDIVVTADDDIYYPTYWLKLLYESYLKYPEYVHAHRAHVTTFCKDGSLQNYFDFKQKVRHCDTHASFRNFSTSGGGVLYPPRSLYKDIANEELFTKLCPTADDIWFWAQAIMHDTKVCVVQNNITEIMPLDSFDDAPKLIYTNCKQNDVQIKNVLEYYPDIMTKLKSEH